MPLKVAVQMDPIASINPRGDSTFAMMLEAQARGHKLDYYTPDTLALRDNVRVRPSRRSRCSTSPRASISRSASSRASTSRPTTSC